MEEVAEDTNVVAMKHHIKACSIWQRIYLQLDRDYRKNRDRKLISHAYAKALEH